MKSILRTTLLLPLLVLLLGAPLANAGDDGKEEVVVMQTSMGEIVLRLYPDLAPKAVENFTGLAKKGYYDKVIFHRIIKDFMAQGGDPTGTGYGGKSIWGVPFEDEFDESVRFDRKGLLAMANAGPKTNGSQFFITLKATPWLNDRHTIFGEVIDGMDVVDAMGEVETGPRDKPIKDVVIEGIRFEKRDAKSTEPEGKKAGEAASQEG